MKKKTGLLIAAVMVMVVVPSAALALPSMPSSLFQPSAGCGCHAGLVDQWSPSMHAKALSDPIYLYEVKLGDEATDGALGPYCNSCHSPIAVMAGELTGIDHSMVTPAGAEGVTCDFCHQVSGTEGEVIGNVSTAVTGDGVKLGPIADPQSGTAHQSAASDFHKTAEFCGNCHDVHHPVNGIPLEATYTEWKNGPYAAEGTVCQDCHMTPGPGVIKPREGKAAASGPVREDVAMMTFAGANVALGDAARAEERLQAAARLDLDVPEIMESGEVSVKTTITNVGAGHYLPTGLTDIRQMWLEVTATDADGKELMSERRDFGTVLKDAEGKYPVLLWEAVGFQSDDRIAPRESTSNDYSFAMTEGAVTVKAALYYRSCSEYIAEASGVEVPTTTMVEVTKTVYSSEDAMGVTDKEFRAMQDGTGGLIGLVFAVVIFGLMGVALVVMKMKMKDA
ncbi:MAG: multiheme c-type cytochrome [Coriobacteriia bacterium]|nr:multiheme c-type cytochrome [Coriobacteriia bacterium]